MLALQEVGDPLGELHHLDSSLKGASRVGQRLAVLLGDQACQLRPVRLEQLAVAGQDAGTAEGRRPSPAGERRLGRDHGAIDVGWTSERTSADGLAESRVEDVADPAARPHDLRAAYPEWKDGCGHNAHEVLRKSGALSSLKLPPTIRKSFRYVTLPRSLTRR